MAIDRNTSRRGVGWIKYILGGAVALLLAIPLLMGIAGQKSTPDTAATDGSGTAPTVSEPATTGSTAPAVPNGASNP